jgi:uncharacterized SAM-binding protein YcdF (DUF218 family)
VTQTGAGGATSTIGRQFGRWPMRPARFVGSIGLTVFLAAAFLPLTNMLSTWMAGDPRLEPAQAIVVPGRGGVDSDGVLSRASLRRTLHAIELHRRQLAPLVVFSGEGPDDLAHSAAEPSGSATEVGARAELARGLGVPKTAVMLVPGGHTTRGEAALVWALLEPMGVRRILLVADPIDTPRMRGTFERVGFEVLPAPTRASGSLRFPEARLALFRELCIEFVGWMYYRLAGHI